MSKTSNISEKKVGFANHILGCIKSSVASRSREGILSLCSSETPTGVL